MTEPHMIRVDSSDLRDLIDERDRLQASLAECTREAMNAADQWRDEIRKLENADEAYGQFRRTIQELMGYDVPELISERQLCDELRGVVSAYRLGFDPRTPAFWTDTPRPPATPQSDTPALATLPPTMTVVIPSMVNAAVNAAADDEAQRARRDAIGTQPPSPAVTADVKYQGDLDKLVGWAADQTGPPATPRHVTPRMWTQHDPEPGPDAVWGVTTELGDLYRPNASEEHGWVWTNHTGGWWRWSTMLAAGPVTEAFPPSPDPREDTRPRASAEPATSDNDANTSSDTEPAW